MQTTRQTGASWQLVLVLWGTKYGVDEVNKLITNICEKAALKPRVVLITDRARPGLLPNVITRDFPPFYLNPILQTGGCQAKLAMFAKGVLPVDLPAVYIDIDTLVLGDLSQFLNLMKTPQTLALFQSAIVPFGPVGRFLWNTTNKKGMRGAILLWWYSTRGIVITSQHFLKNYLRKLMASDYAQ